MTVHSCLLERIILTMSVAPKSTVSIAMCTIAIPLFFIAPSAEYSPTMYFVPWEKSYHTFDISETQ